MVQLWKRINKNKVWIFGSGTFVAFIILLLSLSYLGISTEYSGDIICGNKCVSYFNITLTNYSLCFGSTFKGLYFDKNISYEIYKADLRYRRDNPDRWKPYNLTTKTCLEKGKKYEFMLVGYKNPSDTIKWGANLQGKDIDPYWIGTSGITIPLTQIFYNGEYKVLSQSGNESLYNINITKDKKTGNSQICLEADKDSYELDSKTKVSYIVPSSLSLYKTEKLEKQTNLIKTKASELSATSPSNPNKFCYIADPSKDFYLKFGDESIIVIQNSAVYAGDLVNVTAEVNFTHLNISNTAPYNSLIGYWNFDGDAENTLLTTHYDWSKNNMDGTGIGEALVNNTDCIYGDCARFDGGTTAIDTSSFSSINASTGFVFSFWMKTTATTGMPLSWGPSSKRFCRIGGVTANKLNCAVDGGSTGSSTSVTSINDGNWHYIAISSNGTNQQLYIDGINEGNATETLSTTSGEIRIGGYATSAGYYYNGTVDEVMIFNTTLTSAQVLAIYNNQSARFLATGTQTINTDICYQEFANVSISCGGLDTGVYSNATNYFYVNYSKPNDFSSAVWKVKHGKLDNYAVAIPTNCFNNPIQLRFYSNEIIFDTGISYGQCYNSTDWENITQTSTGAFVSTGGMNGPQDAYDGNWSTGAQYDGVSWGGMGADSPYSVVYEEGIYWINGTNRINVTTYIENNFGSLINLTLGYQNVSGWFYTSPQAVSSGVINTFNMSSTTFNINLNYTFYAGNSTNPFYSPIIKDNVTLTDWYEEGAPPEEIADINYSVALPLGLIRFANCSPDWEFYPSYPIGQDSNIAAINATNNGSATGNFTIRINPSAASKWMLFGCNVSTFSLTNCLTLSTSFQNIWNAVATTETKKIWLYANCSYVTSNPQTSIEMGVS